MGRGSISVKMRQRQSRVRTLARRANGVDRRKRTREEFKRQQELDKIERARRVKEQGEKEEDLGILGKLPGLLKEVKDESGFDEGTGREIARMLRSLNDPNRESSMNGTALIMVCRALYKPGVEILIEEKNAKVNETWYGEDSAIWGIQTALDYVMRLTTHGSRMEKARELEGYLRQNDAKIARELSRW